MRGPARVVQNEHPTYAKVLSFAHDVLDEHGPRRKERIYQLGIFNCPWFAKSNIQIRKECFVNINHYDPRCLGRVDLEVAGRFVFELKVTKRYAPTDYNVEKDRLQLEMYLQAYAYNEHLIDRAALIYFTPTGVVVVEVDCDWSFYPSLVPFLFFF